MENFEHKNQVETSPENELRAYFEEYISEADGSEEKEAWIDYNTIKQTISDLDGGNYESALAYIEGEIARMEAIMEDVEGEDGQEYMQKLSRMREYLASEQV